MNKIEVLLFLIQGVKHLVRLDCHICGLLSFPLHGGVSVECPQDLFIFFYLFSYVFIIIIWRMRESLCVCMHGKEGQRKEEHIKQAPCPA